MLAAEGVGETVIVRAADFTVIVFILNAPFADKLIVLPVVCPVTLVHCDEGVVDRIIVAPLGAPVGTLPFMV